MSKRDLSPIGVRAAELLQRLDRARRRLTQRAAAVARDLERIDEAQAWAGRAQWLIPAAARAPRGARSLEVSDWSSGEEVKVSLPLDPGKPAREQVEAVFARARRLRRGRPIAEARRAEAERAEAAIAALRPALERLAAVPEDEGAPELVAELDAIAARAPSLLPRDLRVLVAPRAAAAPGSTARGQPARKPPFRTFAARSGLPLLVGRRAELNDELTFQVSRPHHWWLHARDRTGAHVIAWNDKGKPLTETELVDAAHLAVHFSDARDERAVDVLYTERRYVRKPRRSPPGLVLADRAKVFPLRADPALLAQLLETEVEDAPPPPKRRTPPR